MKRDWQTIKSILCKTERLTNRATLDYDESCDEVKHYHAQMLAREGYVVTADRTPHDIAIDDPNHEGSRPANHAPRQERLLAIPGSSYILGTAGSQSQQQHDQQHNRANQPHHQP